MTTKAKKSLARYFFYVALVAAGLLVGKLILPFFNAIVLGFLTALIFSPIYKKILSWTGHRQRPAAALTMLSALLLLVLPLILVTHLTVQQLISLHQDTKELTIGRNLDLENLAQLINDSLKNLNLPLQPVSPENIRSGIEQITSHLARFTLDTLLRTGASSIEFLTQAIVYLVIFYFVLPIQKKIPQKIIQFSPLEKDITKMLISRAITMAKAMIKGTFVIAAAQALTGGLLLWIFGAKYVMFWVLLMAFLGVIPLVGPSLVLVPAGLIYMLVLGQVWQGVVIILISAIIIGNIDHLLRPQLVPKSAELHPALVLLGVLGGLKVFGVLGVIYGPVIMIVGVTMATVYQQFLEDTRS